MNHLIRQMMMFGSRKFRIASITRTGGGGQYGGIPSVVFTGGGGTGAAATANMLTQNISGSVTVVDESLNIFTSNGNWPGYTSTSAFPTISFSGGGGSGAAAQYTTWSTNKVVKITGLCEVSSASVSFTISGGGGSGAAVANQTGLLPRRCSVAGVTVANVGSGYTIAPTVVFTKRVNALYVDITEVVAPTAIANISGGQVTSITITNAGEYIRGNLTSGSHGYDVSLSGGNGSGATVQSANLVQPLSWWAGPDSWNGFDAPIGMYITNQGDNYTSAPTITPSNLVSGSLTAIIGRIPGGISVTNGGSGYTSGPTVGVSGGTLASFTPGINYRLAGGNWSSYNYVNTITVTNSGTGYDAAPTISFSGGSPSSAATATANMIPE